MTTYKTMNPVPSASVFDLYDNAQNLDTAMNDRSSPIWVDRLGVQRRTLWGMEQQVNDFLLSTGYQSLGPYAPGLTIESINQVFEKDGELWKPSASLPLPYTTTGVWANESGKFVSVGDGALRQQLGQPGGSALMGFIQSGTGAVAQTQQSRDRQEVRLSDYGGGPGIGASTNDAAFAFALAELAARGGGTLHVNLPGIHDVNAQITSAADNIHIHLGHATTIRYPNTTTSAVYLSGQNCSITGGFGGGWLGPSVWDGTNVVPTYGVLQFGGRGARVTTRLVNVKKVGVWLKDLSDAMISGCVIEGNYPSAQWTGVETVHYGIGADPDALPSGGNFQIVGNRVTGCVQGLFVGNYGTGTAYARGVLVVGNNFEGCWNHGIYSNYTNGMVVSANHFNRCQIPVVASGKFNDIIGNVMYTEEGTETDERDIVGISVRDPSFCNIMGNTIRGRVSSAAVVAINLQYFATLTGPMTGNRVEGNTIELYGTTPGNPIRIIGESSFGQTQITGNTVANNTIMGRVNSDGAILISGITTGNNQGNRVSGNTMILTGGIFAIRMVQVQQGNVSNNTIEWRYDASVANTTVMSVSLVNASRIRVTENQTVVSFNWGANLSPIGVREYGTCTMNSTRDNSDAVDTTKSGAYFPISSLDGSLLDVQESGLGAPAFAARIGSTWRRYPFGAPGATFYVKESGTGSTGWTAK